MKLLWAGLFAPLALVAGDAARPALLGTWDAAATDSQGTRTRWTLAVKQDGSRLTAQLRGEDGAVLNLIDVQNGGDRFRFKLRINPTELVEANLEREGDRLTGAFRGNDSGTGTFKATRIPASDISGVWSGTWEVDPDGRPGPHHMVLQLAGDRVTGTAGPSPEQQARIVNGAFRDGRLTFDIALPNGPLLRFDFMVAGETMWGDAILTMGENQRVFRLSARRGAK